MSTTTVSDAFMQGFIPVRDPNAHKGHFGRVFLLCGAEGYTGAARLAGAAAVRGGAGLVTVGVPRAIYGIVASDACREMMVLPLPDDGQGKLSINAWQWFQERLQNCDAVLMGPGLGRSEDIARLVRHVLEETECPVIVDADGINSLGGHIYEADRVVYTPHEGEFVRMGGELALGREQAVRRFVAAHPCVLVLKGHETLTCAPGGPLYRNTTGNPGMAKGGSGDVLAGLMTALVAQSRAGGWGKDLSLLAAAAVYAHGWAGDAASREKGQGGMTPSDIMEKIPAALCAITGGREHVFSP